MFTLYILISDSTGRFYVGQTSNLEDRLTRHGQGRSRATVSGGPWSLYHSESFPTRAEAVRREREIKAWKSADRIRALKGEHPA